MKYIIALFIAFNAFGATDAELREVEGIINKHSLIKATCKVDTCYVTPTKEISLQEYSDEVKYTRKQLSTLGLKCKEAKYE